jgi:hypothetical protein
VIVAVRPDEIVLSSSEIGEISAESEIDYRGTSFEPRSPPSSDPNGDMNQKACRVQELNRQPRANNC